MNTDVPVRVQMTLMTGRQKKKLLWQGYANLCGVPRLNERVTIDSGLGESFTVVVKDVVWTAATTREPYLPSCVTVRGLGFPNRLVTNKRMIELGWIPTKWRV